MVPSFENSFGALVVLDFVDHVSVEGEGVFHYLLIYVEHLLLVEQLQIH